MPEQSVAARERSARFTEPDVLRTFALLGVIAQHLLGAYARRSGVGPLTRNGVSVLFELVRFAVPLFVFLFGMMLTRNGDRPLRPLRYIGRRAWQLLWPYALWSAVYCGFFTVLSDPAGFLKQLLLGGASYHLWYVPMIFQFVLLAPFFVRLFGWFSRMGRPAVGWVALLAASFGFLVLLACGCLPKALLRVQTALFPSWMLYFTAGALCGRYYHAFCRWTRRLWPACLLVAAVGLGLIIRADFRANAAAGAVAFNVVGLQQPHYALLLLSHFVCLQRLAMGLGRIGWLRRACSFCGRHSYRAYLAHIRCVNRINAELVARFSSLPVYYALLFVLVSVCSLAVAWLLDTVCARLEAAWRAHRKKR